MSSASARLPQLALTQPPRVFWENDLEMGVDYLLAPTRKDGHWSGWLAARTGRQLDILCKALGVDSTGSIQEKRETLLTLSDELDRYYLAERFSQYKSKVAIIDFAKGVLPAEEVEVCRAGEDGYDTTALMLAIFARKWSDLRLIFHLEKIHKTGFARMKMKSQIRKPKQAFEAFLQTDAVQQVLNGFDRSRGDRLTSELKDVVHREGQHLVFIRRADRPDHLVNGTGGVIHGYKSEWIILDFEDGAKRVKISSVSVSVPLEIANRIASAYFGEECEYENESEITYAKQIQRFLGDIRDELVGPLMLVEVIAGNSPLEGSPKIKITDPGSGSIGQALTHFEGTIGKFMADIDCLESVKVLFQKKRVSLIFEKVEGTTDEYVVRYSDSRLNGMQRPEFEQYMRDTHGIVILSTEKRFKRVA